MHRTRKDTSAFGSIASGTNDADGNHQITLGRAWCPACQMKDVELVDALENRHNFVGGKIMVLIAGNFGQQVSRWPHLGLTRLRHFAGVNGACSSSFAVALTELSSPFSLPHYTWCRSLSGRFVCAFQGHRIRLLLVA